MEISELAADAWHLAADRGTRTLIGIAGPPGAGKSTLARALVAELDARHGTGSAAYLPLDGFHLSNAQLERLGLTDRKGSAPSFDVWGYAALLRRVGEEEAGRDVYVPDYDRTLHEPVAARHVVPAPPAGDHGGQLPGLRRAGLAGRAPAPGRGLVPGDT
ncbi:hypothetical protein ACFQ2B_20575 [Streptomyces stramineus]